MIPPRNPWYREALAGSHEPYARVEVWRAGVQVDELLMTDRETALTTNVPAFFDGSIKATLGSRVTRTASLTVPGWMYPWEATDLLNPYGQELRIFQGVRYGNGSPDEFPAFRGSIEKVRPAQNGVCRVEAADRALRVAGAGFVAPVPSQVGTPILDEFERLVLDVDPLAEFGEHDDITALTPALAYDSDRGQALDSLAAAASAHWYTLADGRYVMRFLPWVVAARSAPLLLTDGPGGTIIQAAPERGSEGIYNQVTVTSDRADGGSPIYATASDDDPTSPTYIGGPFGTRSVQVRVTGATNQGQLLVAAKQQVRRARTLTSAWSMSAVTDASIELGDPLKISYQGRPATQFVAAFSYPLGRGEMSLDGRDLRQTDAEL